MTIATNSLLYRKSLGCLIGGLIGDAIGTPTEGKDYWDIVDELGWVDDFDCDGTDDTVMKHLLARALIETGGYATLDDWASTWLADWEAIFGSKVGKFFISVLHTAQKLRRHSIPRMAALGNMPSSSSAMCIAPVGIVNACNPGQAANQAYGLASLIHVHDVGFCQDGAAAVAAAVAAAFDPQATVESVLAAARGNILGLSGRPMLERIDACLALAQEASDYDAFRVAAYQQADRFFCRITCDSRETVPLTFALLRLASGDPKRAVIYAANFGRDADTIGAMVGAIAGALAGIDGFPPEWVTKAERLSQVDQESLVRDLAETALAKMDREARCGALLSRTAEPDPTA